MLSTRSVHVLVSFVRNGFNCLDDRGFFSLPQSGITTDFASNLTDERLQFPRKTE